MEAQAVAAGRCFFFGVSNALSSRYAMISSLFWICALIPAVVEFGGGATTAMTAAFRRILAVFMLACACLFLISSADNLMVWRARHQTLLAVRNELLCDIPDQSLLTRSYTSWPLLQPRMKFLSERKLSVFREKRAFLEYHPVTTNAGKTDNIRSNQPPTPWLNPNLLEINGRAYDAGEKAPARRVILVDSHDMIIASAPVARAADFRQAAWRITLSSAKFPVDTDVKLRVYAVMRDNARIARIGALTVNFPPATNQAMPADFSFNHTHREIAGWSDFFRADAKQAYGSGWARDPATGRAGEWILLTDASTNILGYARVDMDRPDVAQQLHAPQLLKCGWRIAVHQSIPGAGRHVLSAWLLLPEDRQALKLANDFEVTNYFRGESPRK